MDVTTITIGYTEYAVPEGLSKAELGKLLGLLAQLRQVDYYYLGQDAPNVYFLADSYAGVKLADRQLITKAEADHAKAVATAAREAREAAKSE